MQEFRFIDLFAGIGGFRIAGEANGGKCVFTSEIDKFARRTYRAYFGKDHPIHGDIREIAAEDIPEHDMLFGGFPCQPFSVAAYRNRYRADVSIAVAGFDDPRGNLFFEIARILEHHKPKMFLLENVPSFMFHDNNRTCATVMNILNGLGYYTVIDVVTSLGFVPQHRKRCFIAGFLEPNWFNFHLERPNHVKSKLCLHKPPVDPKWLVTKYLWERVVRYEHISPHWRVNPEKPVGALVCDYPSSMNTKFVQYEPDTHPRMLTTREYSRFMGFDSLRGNDYPITQSRTQSFAQFGNAVVPPLVTAIVKKMLHYA